MNTNKIYAEKIASEYAPKQESKVVALRKLDAKAKRPANIFAYTFGIVMTLLLGVGMCVSLKTIGNDALWQNILGYVSGGVGIVGMIINYFIYKKILNSSKQKYAADITTLAKEIAEED